MKGGMVLLGILLLAASIFGAKMVFDQPSTADTKKKVEADANQLPKEILCWGFFDVEPGVAQLNPRQFGDIVGLKPENTPVKAGDVLLQVDDRLGKLQVELAKADIKAAEQQVAEARHLTEFYELQKEQQAYLIKAIDLESEKLALERKTRLDTLEKTQPIYKTTVELYAKGFEQLAEKKKSEVSKLKQLNLQDAQRKILQAEADLEAKNVRLKQAEESLKHFKILAPSDGTVLRVNVRKGEALVPNPLKAAVEFLPKADVVVKAEVLQEWGRFITKEQEVIIEDDTYHGPTWKGTVKSISEWYAPTRSPVIEPFRYNDVRTLECIIRVTDASGSRNGQRVRVKVKLSS